MIHVIMSGHGEISTGVMSASNMIFGEQPGFKAVTFQKKDGLATLQMKFTELLNTVASEDEVLFFVDVFGGTPYNAAAQVAYGKSNIEVITGLSLPLVLEILSRRETMGLKKLVEVLKDVNKDCLKVFSEELKQAQKREKEEEGDLL